MIRGLGFRVLRVQEYVSELTTRKQQKPGHKTFCWTPEGLRFAWEIKRATACKPGTFQELVVVVFHHRARDYNCRLPPPRQARANGRVRRNWCEHTRRGGQTSARLERHARHSQSRITNSRNEGKTYTHTHTQNKPPSRQSQASKNFNSSPPVLESRPPTKEASNHYNFVKLSSNS
jgi:hypothetical protein